MTRVSFVIEIQWQGGFMYILWKLAAWKTRKDQVGNRKIRWETERTGGKQKDQMGNRKIRLETERSGGKQKDQVGNRKIRWETERSGGKQKDQVGNIKIRWETDRLAIDFICRQ